VLMLVATMWLRCQEYLVLTVMIMALFRTL